MNIDATRRALLGAAAATALGGVAAWSLAQPGERVIKVVARRFEFVPDEIRLKKGEPVIFELTSPDTVMGFNVADFGVRTDVVPGRVNTLRLMPDRAGTFGFHCDVFCGSGHEDMAGTLIVSG